MKIGYVMQISELFDQIEQLPMVPEVVRTLIMQLNDPDIDLNSVAADVAKDQVISLKVLKIVNSAHFGLSRKISSIDEAVVMLGMAKLKNIVVASGLTSSVHHVVGMDMKKFWQESIYIAGIAKELAILADESDPDAAFTAGLLSTIGSLLIVMGVPSQSIVIKDKQDAGMGGYEAELEVLGFSSGNLASNLIEKWRFPHILGDAIFAYQKPLLLAKDNALASLLNLAQYLAREKLKSSDFDTIMASFPYDVANNVGLNYEAMECHLDSIFVEISGLDELLN
jgi:HD-like signal output (HDOD) protein